MVYRYVNGETTAQDCIQRGTYGKLWCGTLLHDWGVKNWHGIAASRLKWGVLTLWVHHDVVQRSADGYLWRVTNERTWKNIVLSSTCIVLLWPWSLCKLQTFHWSSLIITDLFVVFVVFAVFVVFVFARLGAAWWVHSLTHQGIGLPPHRGVGSGCRNLGLSAACRMSPHTEECYSKLQQCATGWRWAVFNFIAYAVHCGASWIRCKIRQC